MDLSEKILQVIKAQRLIKSGDTVLIGVSGGPDSVALLGVLSHLKYKLGVNLHVAHFNHRLRSKSDHDEAFVKSLAEKLNLQFHVHRRKSFSPSKSVSEDTARQWRLNFFIKVAQKISATSVALAHTQNDLAETVLMRLLRGAGLSGLRGILGENKIGGQKFIRPLLSIQRIQIERFLQRRHLNYCTDETNKQTAYLRNKVRLKLLPDLIKNYNSNLPNILVDLAYTTQADYNYLLTESQKLFKKNVKVSKTKIKIRLNFFFKQHPSMQRMLLRLSFESLVSNFNQLSFTHIQEVEEMLSSRPVGSIVHWPQSVKVLKSKDALVLS